MGELHFRAEDRLSLFNIKDISLLLIVALI